MEIRILPQRLDGVLWADKCKTEDAVYYISANAFGNRVKVVLPEGRENIAAEIKSLLLSFNAKGTTFDLSEKSYFLPMLSFCACYAFSDTVITVTDLRLASCTADAINALGGKAELVGNTLKIGGNAALKGGTADVGENISVAKAVIFAATCADSPVSVKIKNPAILGEDFISAFSSLGGKIEIF